MARKRKHPEKKRKPPLAAGDRLGSLEVVNPVAGRKNGHRLALVKSTDCDSTCRDCHGKPKLVRADYLRSGRVVSCGKRKRQLRHEHLILKKARGYYTDLDTIDPATLRAALAEPGVDAATGEPIEKAEPKKVVPPVQAKPEPKATKQVTTQTRATHKPVVETPYEHTEAGYHALQWYWNENKKAPPEDFDLKRWYRDQIKKKRAR
jgi:hypothetical protein